jgi:chromosomal replication initiator protein
MYLLREEAHLPLTEIGRVLGNRDHSTVVHGLNRVQQSYYSDPELRREIEGIRRQVDKAS